MIEPIFFMPVLHRRKPTSVCPALYRYCLCRVLLWLCGSINSRQYSLRLSRVPRCPMHSLLPKPCPDRCRQTDFEYLFCFLLFVHRKLFSGCKSNGIFCNTHQARFRAVPDVCLYISVLISVFFFFQFLFCYFLPVYGTPCIDYVCQHKRDEYADVCHCLKCEFAGAAVGNGERALQVGR